MTDNVTCPRCSSEYAYKDGNFWTCPECAHEWHDAAPQQTPSEPDTAVRDANGNLLVTGDSVTVIKDLKVKGSSSTVKSGTKVRNIRILEDAVDGHNIACRIDGIGAMNLKSEFVKKA